jgi:hypothetical protein
MEIKKGEIIFTDGDPAEEMFFIKKGKVVGILP